MTERFADLIDRTFSATEQEIIYRLIRSRRDIRQFAPDPIPPETLLLITSPHLRAQIKVLFEKINEGAAHRVVDQTRKRKQLYRSLKLDARIPDEHRRHLRPATGKPFVLGRTPVPDTDIYSTCLAIQNMRYGFVLAVLLDWSVALFPFLKYPAKPSRSR